MSASPVWIPIFSLFQSLSFNFSQNFAILLVLRLKCCKQIRTVAPCAHERHLSPPTRNIGMMPGKQHLRHMLSAPLRRMGILRILQQTVPVAIFLLKRGFIGSTPGTMRHTASATAIAGISPPVSTKSPINISSTQVSINRWSMPS